MKYIYTAMADYIKPLISHHNGQTEKSKETDIDNEDKVLVSPEGKGDFDYQKYHQLETSPIVDELPKKLPVLSKPELNPFDCYDRISYQTRKLMQTMDKELAENYETQKILERELTKIEKELEKRKKLYDICAVLFNEDILQMERHCEKMKKFDDTLHHHEEVLDSWQCLINDFRKIPSECE